MYETITEPVRQTPIAYEADICVIGGSCTGAFAAIAAARLGAKVAIVENMGFFGGTATASKVCVWHTNMNSTYDHDIFAGLTMELINRLKARDAVIDKGPNPYAQFVFLPDEMIIELDEMVIEAGIRPFLHTRFVGCVKSDDGEVQAAIIEDKSGRRAIKAAVFIDATGDADLVYQMGLPTRTADHLQPPTTCAIVQGVNSVTDGTPHMQFLRENVFDPKYPEALPKGHLWTATLPGEDMIMVAGTRVHGADCSDPDQLTQAEIEGRRQVRAIVDILRKQEGGEAVKLFGLAARIGIRETRHAVCEHQLTEQEVLYGKRFDDAVLNGSYTVDIHLTDDDGIIFRSLDGVEKVIMADGSRTIGRWREETEGLPTFYQMPYRSMIPKGSRNVIVAGRCVDADPGAFGAIRVMVNANQMGQAAGVAAYLALNANQMVGEVDAVKLRQTLESAGQLVLQHD